MASIEPTALAYLSVMRGTLAAQVALYACTGLFTLKSKTNFITYELLNC